MDGRMSLTRMLQSAKRLLVELGAQRTVARSKVDRVVAADADTALRAELLDLADDLGERVEAVETKSRTRQGVPYAEWKAGNTAKAQRAAVLDMLAETEAPAAAPAPEPAARVPRVPRVPPLERMPGEWPARPSVPSALPPSTTPEAENARLRQQLAQLEQQQIGRLAAAFVQEEIRAGRAYPCEQTALTALYGALAQLDLRNPPAAGQLSTVAMLTAVQQSRRPHQLFQQVLPGALPRDAHPLTQNADRLEAAAAQARAWAARIGTPPDTSKA
jgi:hypothetical protein